MEQRLDFYKASLREIKALLAIEARIGKSTLEKSRAELVFLCA
jgi:hypothetical protein